MREGGYLISLYYFEPGVEATFAAGFGGSTRIEHLSDAHRVELSGGRTGMFMFVSCGGSCAPANLWWEQNGVMYQIQKKLKSSTTEKEQERILVNYCLSRCSPPAQGDSGHVRHTSSRCERSILLPRSLLFLASFVWLAVRCEILVFFMAG